MNKTLKIIMAITDLILSVTILYLSINDLYKKGEYTKK